MVYAEAHPERIGHLVLRGICFLRPLEIDWIYQEGSSWLFPKYYEEFISVLPEVERGNILHNSNKKITGKDEAEKLRCAKTLLNGK